jgi:hypothetical protein
MSLSGDTERAISPYRNILCAAATILLCGELFAQAHSPKYDPATETKMKGLVEELRLPPKGQEKEVAHLFMKNGVQCSDLITSGVLVFIFSLGRYGFERFRLGIYERAVTLGQITQKTAVKTVRMGRYLKRPVNVDTVDCCCMIIHSSLVARYNLRFDQALDWHLYVEDFCLGAKYHHDILTKSVQLQSIHYSSGNVNFDFLDKLTYLKKKYKTEAFSTTCYDGYKRF